MKFLIGAEDDTWRIIEDDELRTMLNKKQLPVCESNGIVPMTIYALHNKYRQPVATMTSYGENGWRVKDFVTGECYLKEE